MAFSRFNSFLLVASVISPAFAQSGVLTNGKSTLPSCAQSCTILKQAATACGGTTLVDQTIWNCFCQSGYLTSLRTTDTGICSSECTDPTDSQQVSTWYNANCGTDDGLSEHPNVTPLASGTPAATTTPGATSGGATSTAVNNGSSSSGGGGNSWVDTHYQWIIMIVVLAVGLTGFAFLLIWVRNRYRRKRDQVSGGFNAGITTRHPPTDGGANFPNTSHVNASFTSADAGGTNSPVGSTTVRTRDDYMPYGYGYTRSESRLGYQADRGSSVPVGDVEKQAPSRVQSPDSISVRSKSGRRVLVRDRLSRGPSGYNEKVPQEDAENS